SLLLPLRLADWSGLSLAVGVAVADALEPPAPEPSLRFGRPRIGIKWPNDLWLMDEADSGRKLGGILVETVSAGPHRLAVIGVGLNVRPIAIDEPDNGVASLQELQADADPADALHRVALPLVTALRQFERHGFAPFVARFNARDLLRGHAVRTTQADAAQGVAQGVSPQGALLVQTASGLQQVSSGEVSVRLSAQTDTATPQPPC
ncbi:MAG: biotin--[acetyl-CoA-carboxylase] ligase, partial [Rhizobacter sp.]|nr:biotin--[acetyl-CoA-carboxylase] ligase [Rhizobacter sp.]